MISLAWLTLQLLSLFLVAVFVLRQLSNWARS